MSKLKAKKTSRNKLAKITKAKQKKKKIKKKKKKKKLLDMSSIPHQTFLIVYIVATFWYMKTLTY